jgi:hypothetical protein
MQIIKVNSSLFDVFFNDGWNSYARFRKTNHGLIIYKRSNDLPKGFIDDVETKLLLDDLIALKQINNGLQVA